MKRHLGKIIGTIFFVNMLWDAVKMSAAPNKTMFYIISIIPGIVLGCILGGIVDCMINPRRVKVVVKEDKATRYKNNNGIVEELEHLHNLKLSNAISEDEYIEMKEKLIKKY